jgi:hypothetical protein
MGNVTRTMRMVLVCTILVAGGCLLGCGSRPKKAAPATEAEKAAMQRPTVLAPAKPGANSPK